MEGITYGSKKGPQWGQIIFLVTFDFFALVFFLTSPLYEFLAMGLVEPHYEMDIFNPM